MGIIYIDVLFAVNFIVNIMLYLSSCMIRRKKIIIWRIVCAAAVGAVCSCAFFISDINLHVRNIITIILYLFCAWLVMQYETIRDFIKNVFTILFCALIFAGIFFLIYQYADVGSVVVFNNNALYIDIPVFALLCVSGVCFVAVAWISKAFVRVMGVEEEYAVLVKVGENIINIRAKMDTGNTMVDPISGYAIILADQKKISSLLPVHFEEYVRFGDITRIDPQYHLRLRMVMCKTATGAGLLPALRPDYIRFNCNGKSVELHNVLIAVSKTDLGQYGILFSPLVIEEAEKYVKNC